MSYSGSGTEIINNEMWLVDASSAGCADGTFHGCWVEAGVQASQDSQYMHFFWAQVKPPANTNDYFELDMPMASPGITSNTFIMMQAAQDYSHWQISLVSPVQSFTYIITRDWQGRTMYPNRINAGEEVSGSSGAHSDTTYWFYNEWRDPCCNWYYQDTPGVPQSPGNPPYGGWIYPPPSGPYPGGVFAANTP